MDIYVISFWWCCTGRWYSPPPIGAFIVMVMKGPAYVADPYPLPKAPSVDNGDT